MTACTTGFLYQQYLTTINTHLDRSRDFVYLRNTHNQQATQQQVMGETTAWNYAYKSIFTATTPNILSQLTRNVFFIKLLKNVILSKLTIIFRLGFKGRTKTILHSNDSLHFFWLSFQTSKCSSKAMSTFKSYCLYLV